MFYLLNWRLRCCFPYHPQCSGFNESKYLIKIRENETKNDKMGFQLKEGEGSGNCMSCVVKAVFGIINYSF